MKTYIEILELLEKTSSTNDKISIINSNKDNKELKEYLRLVLDKNITFGIAELPKYELQNKTSHSDVGAMHCFTEVLALLSSRTITGDKARNVIVDFMRQNSPLQDKWFRRLILKSLPSIGIGQTIFEKAYEESGFKFRLQLAEEEAEIDKVEDQPGYLDKKANGIRTIPILVDGKVEIIYGGRDGKSADNFNFIKDELELLASKFGPSWQSVIFDGELHVNDNLKNTMSLYGFKFRTEQDFIGKNGKLKDKAYSDYLADEARILGFQADAKFVIFDAMPKADWDAQKYDKPLFERKLDIERIKYFIGQLDLKRIEIIETEYVACKADAITAAQRWIERGFEGGIWKISAGLYQWKRTRNLIKIKEVQDFEIIITGFEKQKPKYNGDGTLKPDMIGKVLGHDRDGNEHKVGTGEALPESVRIDMYNHPENYIGKISTCSAQCPSGSKFICPRLDILRLDRSSLD